MTMEPRSASISGAVWKEEKRRYHVNNRKTPTPPLGGKYRQAAGGKGKKKERKNAPGMVAAKLDETGGGDPTSFIVGESLFNKRNAGSRTAFCLLQPRQVS